MPVTARLSRNFYDRFGDDVANELVEWFNSVDATYRANLLELNELSFARFSAKIDGLQMAQSFARIDERFAGIDERSAKVDERLAAIDRRFDAIESLLREHLVRIDARFDRFEARIMRWMLTFWVGTLGGLAALVWAMVRAR